MLWYTSTSCLAQSTCPLCNCVGIDLGLGGTTITDVHESGGVIYVANHSGLSISTDGGMTFVNKTNGLGNTFVNGVEVVGGVIYAATNGGLSISMDGGMTFVNKTNGLGSTFVNGVEVVGGVIYAATQDGLSISTDGGMTFVNRTPANGLGTNIINDVEVVGGVIYAATQGGLSISTDGGMTFVNRTSANGLGSTIVNGVEIVGGVIYAANPVGLSISMDGGMTFVNKTNGLGSTFVNDVEVVGGVIYAATQGGLSISTDGGMTFVNKTVADGLFSQFIRGIFINNNIVYTAHTIDGITICGLEAPNITGRDTTICNGQSVDLSTLINGTPLHTLEYGNGNFGTYNLGTTASQSPMNTTTFFVRDSNTTTRCVDTAKIVVTVENQPLITARDTMTMLGEPVDLSSLLNEGVTGSLDFGFTLGNYGLANPVSAQDTMYIIRDSVQNAVGCVDTAKVTITTPISNSSLVDKDGDGQADIADPCNCFDPENVVVENGSNRSVTFFHDFVTITNGGVGQTWVLATVNSGEVLMNNGSPIPMNTALNDLGGGIYRLDLWHRPDIGFNATFRRLNDNATETVGNSCGGNACITIPTMSEWSLLIFGLLVLNLGIFFVQRKQLI